VQRVRLHLHGQRGKRAKEELNNDRDDDTIIIIINAIAIK